MRSVSGTISMMTLIIVSGIGALFISRYPGNCPEEFLEGPAGKSIDPPVGVVDFSAAKRENEPLYPGMIKATLEASNSYRTYGGHPLELLSYSQNNPYSSIIMEHGGIPNFRRVHSFPYSYEKPFSDLRKNHPEHLYPGCIYLIRLKQPTHR